MLLNILCYLRALDVTPPFVAVAEYRTPNLVRLAHFFDQTPARQRHLPLPLLCSQEFPHSLRILRTQSPPLETRNLKLETHLRIWDLHCHLSGVPGLTPEERLSAVAPLRRPHGHRAPLRLHGHEVVAGSHARRTEQVERRHPARHREIPRPRLRRSCI